MKKTLNLFLVLTIFMSCDRKTGTFETENHIDKFGKAFKIEYYFNANSSDTPNFIIREIDELNNILNDISKANNPEPWKGAGWSEIKIYFKDTTWSINTNGKKIGIGSSGNFYDLPDNNFITKTKIERVEWQQPTLGLALLGLDEYCLSICSLLCFSSGLTL